MRGDHILGKGFHIITPEPIDSHTSLPPTRTGRFSKVILLGQRLGRAWPALKRSYRRLEIALHTTATRPKSWRGTIPKRYLVHGVFLMLMAGIVWHGRTTVGADRSSFLYALVSGDLVTEGPLDPSAYAQSDAPGVGGARLAAIGADDAIDIITFDDAEVDFANTLGGNAVIAPQQPLVPEPGSDDTPPRSTAPRPQIYTVESGDTIAGIAAQFDVSTNTILWANGLRASSTLKVGDNLTILPTTGVLHTVKSGDTVSGIASRYDAKGKDIMAYNNLAEDAKLAIGQKIIVPDGYIEEVAAPRIVPRDTVVAGRDHEGPTPEPVDSPGGGMVWPTTTRHISQYFRWGHTGIDIDNRSRPAIYAAAAGTVEFAGWMGGYGNLIIVSHGNGTQTYYAHLDKFYVAKGASIGKGAAIGQMGSTGRSTGPHLHFEYRVNGRPINPLGLY